jgi:hypothetical protein
VELRADGDEEKQMEQKDTTNTYKHIHTDIHTYIHTHIHTCIHAYVYKKKGRGEEE